MSHLVTGVAGFIGFHVARRLLERGGEVVGVDSLNSYYDVGLKEARLRELAGNPQFRFLRLDLADKGAADAMFAREAPRRVIHLAAQPGVRYSLEQPAAYVESNIVGFMNVLEGCRRCEAVHLTYASSSSVYGANRSVPFSVHDNVDHPLSLYAATKKANELMAHTYSHLFGLPTTGLRFFTVYGPWGRPDMAPFLFAKAILSGTPIDVFNNGSMQRDFTYVDDIVEGVIRVSDRPATGEPGWTGLHPDPATSAAPYRVFNIGNNEPVELLAFIACLEEALGKRADMRMLPMQAGDMVATSANIEDLRNWTGFAPSTPLARGVEKFVDWYRGYYNV